MKPAHRPGGVYIAALLIFSLLLTGVLALEAHSTFLEHRATAERVLRDYSKLAAARLGSRTSNELFYYGMMPALDALWDSHAWHPGTAVTAPAQLVKGLSSPATDLLKQARYSFRLGLHTGEVSTSCDTLSAETRRWLMDTVKVNIRTVYIEDEKISAIVTTHGGIRRLIFYHVGSTSQGPHAGWAKDQKGDVAIGFEVDPRAIEPFYSMGASKFPLLPRPLTGGVIYDSVGSMIVADGDGRELYRSPVQYPPTFSARDTSEAMMGGMQYQISLRPEMASALVIGGLPRSRLPLLLSVLALTAGLIVGALFQLRREYELARLRSDFVSGVSHELRTPLAQIRMFGETLLLGRVRSDEERRRSLEIIDQEARRLTHLVENLLHFSRSERQATRVAPEPTLLGPFLRSVTEAFAPLAAARAVQLAVAPTPPDCTVALADPAALRQMLLNLLDNAVKYGPDGQTVTVGCQAGDPGRVRVYVSDQGPGVPEADRERVWERFWRLERDRGSAIAGTGIGLSVVRELAALHGGRSWVEQGSQGGCRFVIELPTASATSPDASRPSPVPPVTQPQERATV